MRFSRMMSCSLAAMLAMHATAGQSAEHVINAEARIFNPDILYVQPGDTINFVNMTSHDAKSVEGLIPEGAQPFDSGIGNNITLKYDIEGTYAYVCVPHIGFGMVGIIVVGKPVDIDAKLEWAQANLQGPYRRLIAKMLKVQNAAKGQ